MRTNIEIDDKLMADALEATGLKTKKDAVELGLKTLIRLHKQAEIKKFRGKLQWEGALEEMRAQAHACSRHSCLARTIQNEHSSI